MKNPTERVIKFRGINPQGRWFYGSLYINERGDTFTDRSSWQRETVSPDTVGQFTGLHDKNGKEIYEGDIVRQNNSYNSEVKFNNRYGGYEPWCTQIEGCDNPEEYPCEIIGNIYQNPELLN